MGVEGFKVYNGCISSLMQRYSVVYKTVSGECKSIDFLTVEEWKKELLKIIERYESKNLFSADETGLFFRLPSNKTLSLKGDLCSGGNDTKERITVLLACNADGTDKLHH
jgi:hypothetical protein